MEKENVAMSAFNLKSECVSTKNLCRICFSETSAFLNVFETFIEDNMTLAAMFMNYLRQDMYPDDDLPNFICCDCVEEVTDTENINEEWKRTLRHLVWRTRVLKQVESLEVKEKLIESRFKLPLRNLISNDEKKLRSKILENLERISPDLLNNDEVIKTHYCKICQRMFRSENKLELHRKSCQESYSHHCSVCGGVFFNLKDLNQHKNVFHNVVKCFPCGRCLRKFKSQNKLVRHIERYNFNCKSQMECSISNIVEDSYFTTDDHLSSKGMIIESEKVVGKKQSNLEQKLKNLLKKDVNYICCMCVGFSAPRNILMAHLKEIHSSVFPVTCKFCRIGFISRLDLALHMYVHDKEFSCDVCKREFFTKRYYSHHIKVCQEKSVVHKCNICGMEVSSKENLMLHMSTHSLLRKYACPHCPRNFKLNSNLLKHVRNVHMKLKPHECGICHKWFARRFHLVMHLSIHSDERPYGCSLCDKHFKTKSAINGHMKSFHKIVRPPKKEIIIDAHLTENLT